MASCSRALSIVVAALVITIPARADEPAEGAPSASDPDTPAAVTMPIEPAGPGAPPLAIEHRGSHWQSRWPRFHLVEAATMLAAEGAAIAVYVTEPNRSPHWHGTLPLDPELRDAWRLDSYDDQQTIDLISTAMFAGIALWPAVVDAVLLAGLVHGDGDVALQMLLIDAEAMAIAHVVTWMTTRLVGRVRPRHQDCVLDDTCRDRGVGPVASFVSGHTLFAYAGAGLVCSHHIVHPWLLGSSEGAVTACATGLVLATATGVMRVMTDLHWASDVAISAIIGSTIGFGVPFLFHYARPRDAGAMAFMVAPGVANEPAGLSVSGFF